MLQLISIQFEGWTAHRSVDYRLCRVNKEYIPYSRPAVCGTNYLSGHLSGSNPVTDIKIAPSNQSGLLCGKKLAICGLGVCTFVMPERWPYHASFIYSNCLQLRTFGACLVILIDDILSHCMVVIKYLINFYLVLHSRIHITQHIIIEIESFLKNQYRIS